MKDLLALDYQHKFLVKETENSVYNALTEHIPNWWTEDFSGASSSLNAEFTVRFGTTFKTMKVLELVPNKKIVWLCIDTLIDIPELQNNREWKDTTIAWNMEIEGKHTKISITHIGLTPEVACFKICEKGWESFLESLKKYLETGKGTPYKN